MTSYDQGGMARRRPLPPHSDDLAGYSPYGQDRGLVGILAVAVLVVAALVGGLIDVSSGNGLATLYGLGFVAGCVGSALAVRMSDKLWVVFAPSLVFGAVAVLGAVQQSRKLDRQLISLDTASETFLRLIDPGKAPYLLAGFALSLAVVLVRMALIRK